MINIPWWGYQHVWLVCTAFQRSAKQELPRHQSPGLARPEISSYRISQQKQISVSPEEPAQPTPPLWCPRAVPPQTAVLFHPKVLKRDPGAQKVPASAKSQIWNSRAGLWDTTPRHCSAVPSPQPRMWGTSPPPGPLLGHLTCAPVQRCLKFQSLTTPRSWSCWYAPPWAPEFRSSWHNARIILFIFKIWDA